MITEPKLPPKKGYVEVELENGERAYMNASTGVLEKDEVPTPSDEEKIQTLQQENKLLKAQVQAQSGQLDFLEDCIAEMAMQVYDV